MKILAGDIGGTKTWLRVAEFSAGSPLGRVIREQRYPSRDYVGLLPMVREFLAQDGAASSPLASACFGVAGPIDQTAHGQSVKVTNLPWEIDTRMLADETSIARIKLLNDFQAIGYGIEALEAGDLAMLQPGQAQVNAPRLVIGPGTGLGMAILVWSDDHYEVMSSEGGHSDFAPTDDIQAGLLKFLTKRFRRASYERVLSGPGIVNIYEFLCEQYRGKTILELSEALQVDDPAAAVTLAAQTGQNPLAVQAVDIFIKVCGAFASNLALVALSRGGVYIAGGIAPKLVERFSAGDFVHSFNNKGRMSSLLLDMPVRIVLNAQVGLIGAALVASRLNK